MARQFALVLLWLGLTAEVEGFVFGGRWSTPLTWVGTLIFNGVPGLHVFPWDAMVLCTLAAGLSDRNGKANRSRELLRSIRITLGFLALSWSWGVLRGGSAYQTMFQLHSFVMQLFVAQMVMATHRTAAHISTLGKVVIFAAFYRCCVLFAFYLVVARHLPYELPALTDHADCALFVSGLLILVINVLIRPSVGAWSWLCTGAIVISTAIVMNNRRIAWLQLEAGLLCAYFLLPLNKMKRTMNATLLALSPLILLYIVAGWGHPVGIFKPVGSISTMFGQNQDTSSVMRDIENYNLIKTLKAHPFLGLGWGNEYIEEVRALDISSMFPQYRYLPHNSLLGALAFTGMIGFAGIWQVVPVACFLLARGSQLAKSPVLRIAGISGFTAIVVCVLHMWGDLGFSHLMVNTVLGTAVGLAGRLTSKIGRAHV